MSPSAENKARHKKYKSWRFRGIRISKKYWKTKTDASCVDSVVLSSAGPRPGRAAPVAGGAGANSARREAPGGNFPHDRGLRAGIQSVQAGNSVIDRAKIQGTA